MNKVRSFVSTILLCVILNAEGVERQNKNDKGLEGVIDGWGIGLGVTINNGSQKSIDDAQIVNGVVRITRERQVTPRLMVEAHSYFNATSTFGCFIALQTGGSQIIDAIGAGLLFTSKASDYSKLKCIHWGFGVSNVFNSRVLGDGLHENQPLPPGETQIRYKETNRVGVLLFVSTSF